MNLLKHIYTGYTLLTGRLFYISMCLCSEYTLECDELYSMNEFIGNNCAMFFTNATIEFTWLNDGSGKLVSKNRTSISLKQKGGGPGVVVSTAAFHARVRSSFPGLGGLKETKNISSPSTCESQYCGEPP